MAILDADKEGYLRSESSLIQTCGRAARNVDGRVIMYANATTGSMERALGEMDRRREKQLAYNEARGITPRSVKKSIDDVLKSVYENDYVTVEMAAEEPEDYVATLDIGKTMKALRKRMKEAADRMDFEKAAEYRDRLMSLEKRQIEIGA